MTTLGIHTIKAARGSKKTAKRVGRGNASGHGNYSCRGGKGQTARSGGSRGLARKAFRRILQSTPKLGGFKSMATKPETVTLAMLEKNFSSGDTVTIVTLREKNVIGKNIAAVKIVNTGELSKKLTVTGIKCTKIALEKIAAVGGEVK